jgi:release factor glutamine methyltransferase
MALVSGHDGLDALRRITGDAPHHLATGGWLVVEHGWDQGQAVRALFAAARFCAIRTHTDLGGHERVTEGRLAPE